jgi:hypothetical protein
MQGPGSRCSGLPFAAIRGGNWNNGTEAGAFAFNANNGPSNWNWNIGFRCSSGVTARIARKAVRRQHPGAHGCPGRAHHPP